MDILLLIGGGVLIMVGANFLTDGAASIANRFHISHLVIGLTIVAFGTSAPELSVSLISAMKGSSDIAIGNVVGSNIVNTLLILGCTATIVPIAIAKSTVKKEIPLCLLISVFLWICANDVFFDGAAGNMISRVDGLLLLCFFLVFLGYTFSIARQGGESSDVEIKDLPVWKSVLYIIGGLAALVYGGEFFVNGATGIARALGVSESIIALTIVSIGTSLPELATSVVAALKKNPDLAVGNVVGSNIFNILLVLGTSSTIIPMNVSGITNVDFGVMVLSCLLLMVFSYFFGKRTIKRWEGVVLLVVYAGYLGYLIHTA